MQAPTTWTALGQSDYPSALTELTDATVQAAGIIKGWLAGDGLLSSPNYSTYDTAIWKWLNSRYTTKQLGKMMGYTFSYLSGYLGCERTIAAINGQTLPTRQNGTQKLGNILPLLTNNTVASATNLAFKKDNVFQLANHFFDLVNGEFYGIAQQSGYSLSALSNYQAFINGFTSGLTQGASVMFSELFDAGWDLGNTYGYSIGYASGFRDGYSEGYGAGWQEGYASGYTAGQQTWMSGLTNILSNLGALISDTSTIMKILGDVATVGEVLGAIF